MSDSIVISSAEDIDLNRHGIIEAHAGTGKTHTIVNLVLRMLGQPAAEGNDGGFVHLRDIMLVTYTEKAAGELKKRIYDGIVERIGKTSDKGLAAHLEACLNNMHEALIGTIHSVCLRLLRTWPFETGVHFDTEIIASESGEIAPLLRESMRTDWQDESARLPRALKAAERLGISLGNRHFDLIGKTAQELLGGDDSRMDTSAAGGMTLESLIDAAESPEAAPDPKKLRSRLLHAFVHRAAEALAARYDAHKRKRGLISYDDMLRLTRDAVRGGDGVMLKTLRQRLRYGIIDEFQDTRPVQWDIFRKIFLDDDDARLKNVMYIVGDPKQSIYSFQNADILSYIDAKNTITRHRRGGAVYRLTANYRSLPQMIAGYNSILGCGDDWFLFDGGGISYPPEQHARPPKREDAPKYPLRHKAVQVVSIDGGMNAGESRRAMAAATRDAIRKLRGTTITIPKGAGYEDIELDYRDFAVIVETNDMADFFIDEFKASGIPYSKYKQPGIFKSDMARDLRAVLTAVVKRRSREHRAAMLLTHFFNRPPETTDPDENSKRCEKHYCAGDDLCAAHALDSWGTLADRQLWAQLFESVARRTKIKQRLIRLVDGERKLADLRQVTDYCVEYLYRKNSNLEQLTDHLERLYRGREDAGRDRNIHTLSTERSSVTILTMHTSKGLEFPVAFIMHKETVRVSPDILKWADGENNKLFTPYFTVGEDGKVLAGQIEADKAERRRERRRLLYVAMTRPRAMLFAPMLKKDRELSPRLKELLDRGDPSLELFDAEKFGGDAYTPTKRRDFDARSLTQLDDIPELSLRVFVGRETSYTGMSAVLKERGNDVAAGDGGDGNGDPAIDGQYGGDGNDALPVNETHASDIDADSGDGLPGGRLTGVALHKAIETALKADDINAILDDNDALDSIAEICLRQNGVLSRPSVRDPATMTGIASAMIRNALTAAYPVGANDEDGDLVVVSALPRADRVPEADFLFSAAPHRVCGSMDLLFRARNDAHPAHPYRYHFIDWKSDTLKSYGAESLRKHCADRNYCLQSKIYAVALDRYLRGILGDNYNRDENLGKSIYVFLRGNAAFVSEDLKIHALDCEWLNALPRLA